MKLIGIVLAGIALAGGTLFFWFDRDYPITHYPPKNERIVAFGDSLVYGQGATKGNDFPTLLGKEIGRPITNLGVPGDTTAEGLKRVEAVIKLDPGIVMLLLGGNDTLRRLPLSETEANLRALIERFQGTGAVVVLLGVRGGLLTDGKDDLYASLAEEYGLVYMHDVLDGLLLKPELMHDSIHPNDQGYALIAERLVEIFQEYELVL